jgi:hypothetical protein
MKIILEIRLNYKIDRQGMIRMGIVNIQLFSRSVIIKVLWSIIKIIKISNGS